MATISRELNSVSLGRMFGWNRARFDRELETFDFEGGWTSSLHQPKYFMLALEAQLTDLLLGELEP